MKSKIGLLMTAKTLDFAIQIPNGTPITKAIKLDVRTKVNVWVISRQNPWFQMYNRPIASKISNVQCFVFRFSQYVAPRMINMNSQIGRMSKTHWKPLMMPPIKLVTPLKKPSKLASQSTNLSIQLETGNCGMLFILCHLISWNGTQNGTSDNNSE